VPGAAGNPSAALVATLIGEGKEGAMPSERVAELRAFIDADWHEIAVPVPVSGALLLRSAWRGWVRRFTRRVPDDRAEHLRV
jgi:hypothetical protein